MMLECWRHSAARRPSFIQLLDQLAPDLSDDFQTVSFYFNHEPDNDDAAADIDSIDSRNASVEDLNSETVPFRTASARDPTDSAADGKVSDSWDTPDQNELQLSGFVGQSSAERKPQNAEFIEMSTPPNAATTNTSSEAGRYHTNEEEPRNSRQSSRETAASCRKDFFDAAAEYGSKDSSGSSQGSRKNGLINGHVILFGGALHSEVH